MPYREYGNTGEEVSSLGLGCMRFPMRDGKVQQRKAEGIVKRALSQGINYYDSAVMYCKDQSESALGKALDGVDDVKISTKNHYKGDDPGEWLAFLDQSLERLGRDHIDFYHLHDLRLSQYSEHLLPGGIIDEARRAREEGRIRHLCFSSHDDPVNIAKLIDTGVFEGMLVQYNLLDRHNEDVIGYAGEKGLGVSIMGTLAGGQLLPLHETFSDMISGQKEIAELGIRFVLSNPNISVALSGMQTPEMVEENAATASRPEPLSLEEKKSISAIMDAARELKGIYCTGCQYCMPCPAGVDIPANFSAYNLLEIWGLEGRAKRQYKALGSRKEEGEPKAAWAEACNACGICVEKCPQDIDIPAELERISARLSD